MAGVLGISGGALVTLLSLHYIIYFIFVILDFLIPPPIYISGLSLFYEFIITVIMLICCVHDLVGGILFYKDKKAGKFLMLVGGQIGIATSCFHLIMNLISLTPMVGSSILHIMILNALWNFLIWLFGHSEATIGGILGLKVDYY